jgi:hypothetical protein
MDGYQFAASIIQSVVSLAWPAAIFGCAWLFREKLRELLPLLRFKYKDVEASFRLEQAGKEAAELPAVTAGESEPTPEEKSKLELMAEISPRAVILEGRSELEEQVRSLAELAGIPVARKGSLLQLINALRNREVIESRVARFVHDLRAYGNTVAHGQVETEATKTDALQFRQLVSLAISELEEAQKRITGRGSV